MPAEYRPPVPVKVRTARKQHRCDAFACRTPIEPGERYEIYAAPPWTDGNEGPRWVTLKSHLGGWNGTGCAEAAAYRENAARELANVPVR